MRLSLVDLNKGEALASPFLVRLEKEVYNSEDY